MAASTGSTGRGARVSIGFAGAEPIDFGNVTALEYWTARDAVECAPGKCGRVTIVAHMAADLGQIMLMQSAAASLVIHVDYSGCGHDMAESFQARFHSLGHVRVAVDAAIERTFHFDMLSLPSMVVNAEADQAA